MDTAAVDRWLQAYVEAWKSYERSRIRALFADATRYRYHPYDDAVEGREAVVASWLGEDNAAGASTRDEPGTFHTIAVDHDIAVATGSTSYRAEAGGPVDRAFDNCFVMRFDDDGRCTEFTEWFVERPRPST